MKGKPVALATPLFSGCTDCYIATNIRFGAEADGIAWVYGWYQNKQNTIELLMKNLNDKVILRQRSGNRIVAKQAAPFTLEPLTAYAVYLEYNGTAFSLSIDGNHILDLIPASAPAAGTIGFGAKAGAASFDFVEVN